MIEKTAKNSISLGRVPIQALNKPVGWDFFDGEQELSVSLMKIASLDKTVDELGGYDLTAAIEKNPDHLFVKVFAIKKDEVNDNGDAFSESELIKATPTFVGVPIFCNHANDDIEKARGKVVHAWYDHAKGGIFIISMVDKVAYPKLARGIEEGYINGTSMGTQVQGSCCSICHHYATTADKYCSHIKEKKTRKLSGEVKCQYHKSKEKHKGYEDKCPICNCTADTASSTLHKDAVVYEHNFGLKFIEDSFVVNPACHDCLVECILNVPEFTRKVAYINSKVDMNKVAMSNSDALVKVAGKQEIDSLNKAMKHMEVVAKSMMDQKQKVSMEYVSDIVEVLASLQTVTDELVEMGYAAIPSPPSFQNPELLPDASPITGGTGVQATPGQMPSPGAAPTAPAQMAPAPTSGGYATTPAAGGIGSVTKPTLSASEKIKELHKQGSNIKKKISSLSEIISKHKDSKVDYQLTRNNITITAGKNSDGGLIVSTFVDGKHLRTEEEMSPGKLTEAFTKNPDESALTLIAQVEKEINPPTKESENNMSNTNVKTAASEIPQVTTEKQLNEKGGQLEFAGKRQDKAIEGITESKEQLGQSKEPVNDTSSDSPQVRKDDYANQVWEGQLEAMAKSPIARWKSAPDVITEKQWTDFTRLVGGEGVDDESANITEGQIKDLLKNHRWVEPNFTTEHQLASDKNWLTTDHAWGNKEAAATYAKKLVEASINALSDTIALFKHTPSEVVQSVKYITKDPQSQIKASYLVLVNGIPAKVASRKSEKARIAYFGKTASSNEGGPVDSVLACMGDHCVNLKAEDFIDAVRHVASDPAKMAKVEEVAKAKMANANTNESDTVIDKFAAFDSAFASMNAPAEAVAADDGMYQVRAGIEEIGVGLDNVDGFIAAAETHARSLVKEADTVLYSVDVDTDNGTVVTTLKSASKLTDDEKEAATKMASRSANRENLVKEAQMMGGQMGGGMGGGDMSGGGGGGATMPTPPAGAPAPGAPGAPAPLEQMDTAGNEPLEDEKSGEPMPPGTICPLCGTEDVDVVAGQANCKNPQCGAKFKIKVNLEIIEGPGIAGGETPKGEGEEGLAGEEAGLGEEAAAGGGEGFPMPAGETPNIPVAAMTRINPDMITKLSANKDWQLGGFSPLTGSTNVFKTANNNWLCLDTGVEYKVETLVNPEEPKAMWLQWSWTPKFASKSCPTCDRAKAAWTKALASNGMTDAQFDDLSFKKKAETILAMEKAGLFNVVKTASKNSSVMAEIQKQFKLAGTFPTDLCKQKLANRYGPESIAISGPCKGENLADCVCEQLKKASVYSDGFAMKLADTWSEKDSCLECMEDYIRVGLDIEKAASVCQHMKLKYATNTELFGEEMNNAPIEEPVDETAPGTEPVGDEFGDEDPFASEGEELGGELGGEIGGEPEVEVEIGGELGGLEAPGTELPGAGPEVPPAGGIEVKVDSGAKPGEGAVTIELPLSAVDAIEKAIDIVHGQDPAAEEHHDIPPSLENTEVPLDIPGEAVAPLEEAASQTLEDATGAPGEEGEEGASVEPTGVEIEVDATPSLEGALPEGDNAEVDGGMGEESVELEEDAEKPESFGEEEEEGEGETEEEKAMKKDQIALASYMRKGYNNRVGQINLDVSGILAAINKKAGTVEIQKAQDSVGKVSDGKTLGNEEKFKADKPDVPRGNATMGAEPKDLNPKDKPLPEVPTGDGSMGQEKALGYTADGATATGGDKGQGKTDTKNKEASAKPATKVASEKKIEQESVADNVKGKKVDYTGGKDHKNTPDNLKRTPVEEKDSVKIPEKGEGSFIGDEKKSIGKLPEEPSIPTGGGKNPKFDKNEKNTPEDTNKVKGTVIASDEKSKTNAEAVRIAGRMIEAKIIEASQLMNKIAELQQYKLSQLQDIEKSLFKSANKGLTTVSDGVEQPVPNSEGTGQVNLKDQIRSMFSLDRQNVIASELTDADLRKAHGR